jgi:hypothetical protein
VILAGLLLQAAIYSRDVAPVLALHCNRCHGDDYTGGGVDTRTYENLKRTANLGLLIELIEGRRGGNQRMPRDAPPLDAAAIAKIREWVNDGARFDHEPSGESLRREISKKPEVRVQLRAAGRAYAVLEILGPNGTLIHRETTVINDVHQWTLRTSKYWPLKFTLSVNVRYASGPATLDILP